MGTFHDNLGDLHGITVVVETHGARVYIGRCHEEKPEGILLLDVDYNEAKTEEERRAYLDKAARFGVWKKEAQVLVPQEDVKAVRRLAEYGGA